ASVTLLRCGTHDDADTVARHPGLEGLLERIGERDFIIPARSAAKIRKTLAAIGLSPRRELEGTDEPIHRYPLAAVTDHISSDSPDSEIRPYDSSAVPSSWTKEWRSYHVSTARQLIEQAIHWQTAVGLRIGRAEVKWIPESVIPGEPWSVIGWYASEEGAEAPVRATLQPGEWSDMRLLVPFTS
ncbi:hypothetical protein WG8_3031, partial [Paenibacillus sp. Aloe-11]